MGTEFRAVGDVISPERLRRRVETDLARAAENYRTENTVAPARKAKKVELKKAAALPPAKTNSADSIRIRRTEIPKCPLLQSLRIRKTILLNVEMCPPRMDLPMEQSVEAWIDSNHLMRKIDALRRFVFMTDGAIGRREEPNLVM